MARFYFIESTTIRSHTEGKLKKQESVKYRYSNYPTEQPSKAEKRQKLKGREWNISLRKGPQRRFPRKCIENTFSLIQSTFKSLEMHSKRRYKSCICSVVLGQLESFRNYLGPQYYFPENFRCTFRFYESENFSDSSLHRIFESENFKCPFSMKNRLTWGLKCES